MLRTTTMSELPSPADQASAAFQLAGGSLPADAPLIGLEVRFWFDHKSSAVRKHKLSIAASYYDIIRAAGGRPVLLPPFLDDLGFWASQLDGLMMSGGDDVLPQRYGQPPHHTLDPMLPTQDQAAFELVDFADRTQLPTLGICLGAQIMNVHRGGTLHQHIPDAFPSSPVRHNAAGASAWHDATLRPGRLLDIVGSPNAHVTSRHHQAVDRLGRGLQVNAMAADGVIEGVEDRSRPFFIGVQWHGEDMPSDPATTRLLRALIAAARAHRATRSTRVLAGV